MKKRPEKPEKTSIALTVNADEIGLDSFIAVLQALSEFWDNYGSSEAPVSVTLQVGDSVTTWGEE